GGAQRRARRPGGGGHHHQRGRGDQSSVPRPRCHELRSCGPRGGTRPTRPERPSARSPPDPWPLRARSSPSWQPGERGCAFFDDGISTYVHFRAQGHLGPGRLQVAALDLFSEITLPFPFPEGFFVETLKTAPLSRPGPENGPETFEPPCQKG